MTTYRISQPAERSGVPATTPRFHETAELLPAVLAACALCCAGPLLAVLGGVGAASAIGALWTPVLAAPAVAAAAAMFAVRRRRRAAACRTAPAHADLGMPALGRPTGYGTPRDGRAGSGRGAVKRPRGPLAAGAADRL